MRNCAIILAAALAAAQTAAAKSHFVVFDHLLRVPALCYPLDSGWTGMGWIRWEVPAKTNPYLQSVILVNPSRRQIVQTAGQLNRGSFVLEQSGGIYSDANAMAAQMAREINSGIVVPGLKSFVPKYGRFSDAIPAKTRKAVDFLFAANRTSPVKKAFKVECFFDCEYNGEKCEALYEYVCAFSAVQVRPTLPTIASVIEFDRFLTVAPPGGIAAAKKAGGRQLAGAYVNRNWKFAAERTMQAIVKGKLIGMNEGMALMREAQAENERVMTEVRRKWHEMIKEVKTVDNPLAPGEKIERPMYFDHSLINSAQNTMVLSDSSLDPHEVEKLVGQGFWTAVD